jgi:anion-transporting  ArsA/GET3 family ATPase
MIDRQLIIIGGKGGVGRTSVAAALACVLARRGKRILLAHARTKQNVATLLGTRIVDEKIRLVEPNLWAVNMNPQAALRERGVMVLKFRAISKAVLENRLLKYFLRAIPGLDEYSMLGKAWYHTTEMEGSRRRFDTVIFDGPATGHLLSMLRIPQVILDTVPDGPLTADALKARDLLVDPARTSLWIVTLAEEMPVSEAVDLHAQISTELHIPAERLVVNALYPDRFERDPALDGALDKLAAVAPEDLELLELLRVGTMLRNRRRINRAYLDRLARRIPLPRIELPYLFSPSLGRPELDTLAAQIEAALG